MTVGLFSAPVVNVETEMANGSFAKPIYVLLKELGGRTNNAALNLMLDELVKEMNQKDVKLFVENARRKFIPSSVKGIVLPDAVFEVSGDDHPEDFLTCDFCDESFNQFEGYYEKGGLIQCTYCPCEGEDA